MEQQLLFLLDFDLRYDEKQASNISRRLCLTVCRLPNKILRRASPPFVVSMLAVRDPVLMFGRSFLLRLLRMQLSPPAWKLLASRLMVTSTFPSLVRPLALALMETLR